ncbi:MAG: DUF1232 domain-containing protein [Endomicrobium sp.]|jgi:uncharacterized membrane protein YkvA (DUF1232 family)|nr:DUF1232 domain-containing protein [Endomicrobium sp.]
MEDKKEGANAATPEVVKKKSRLSFAWIILLVAVIYTISPADAIPDVVPVGGWLDDIIINAAAILNLIIKYRKRNKD